MRPSFLKDIPSTDVFLKSGRLPLPHGRRLFPLLLDAKRRCLVNLSFLLTVQGDHRLILRRKSSESPVGLHRQVRRERVCQSLILADELRPFLARGLTSSRAESHRGKGTLFPSVKILPPGEMSSDPRNSI